jgi:hypothetical protein
MRKNILFLLVLGVVSGFHCVTSLAQTTEPQTQSAIEEQSAKIYNSLSLFSKSDKGAYYKSFTPEIKSELWKIQLKSYLSKHSELTDKQRKIIEDGIAFITPDVYKISQNSREWEEKVNKPAQLLKDRMLEVFPLEVAKKLLTELGGAPAPVTLNFRQINFIPGVNSAGCGGAKQTANPELMRKPIKTQQHLFSVISAGLVPETCDCSIYSDWCVQGTECDYGNCKQAQFCGTLGLYVCNGICILV